MKEKTYNLVYQTTNLINNKIYIGVHSTNNIDDGYLGSGTYITNALNYYGRENFKVEILKHFKSKEEAFKYEKKLVDQEFVKRDDSYNLRIGGAGNNNGHSLSMRQKMSEAGKQYNKNHPEKVEKHSEFMKQWVIDNPEKAKERQEKAVEKCRTSEARKNNSDRNKQWVIDNPEKAKERQEKATSSKRTLEHRELRSKLSKKRWCDPEEHKKASEIIKQYNKNHPEKGKKHSEFMKNISKIKCQYCDEMFSPMVIKRHENICFKNPNPVKNKRKYYPTTPCKYCKRLMNNNLLNRHENVCKSNPKNIRS